MAKGVYVSKVLAIGTVVMTASAVAGIITMIIVYQIQINERPPIPPPTMAITTPYPTGLPLTMRLPGNVIPESYQVTLQPYLYTALSNITNQTFTFTGHSTVILKCMESTKTIILHSKDLNVNKIKVSAGNVLGRNIADSWESHDNDTNFLEIQLTEALLENKTYILSTAFEGELLDDLAGFYRSRYTENENEERFLATSQLQPTDARKVFPCFDEPALKAVFNITIIHRIGTKAISNAEIQNSQETEEGWIETKFHPTMVMSTYLLAFTVSTFDYIELSHKKEIKIWARPEALNAGHADYAYNITGKILDFYGELFGIEYPLSKLDQIALPDFSAGAMENWGLIMYRETALLFEEGVSSTSNKEWIATVIAHELAHQWFGNLVTMKWWNDIWLNEGFATYMSYRAVESVENEWNMEDLFVLNDIQTVFQVDSMATSYPLSSAEEDIDSPSDIGNLFDSITYSKGAAVLRMLSNYIGEQVFYSGLRKYLDKFKYQNAEDKDLWKCIQEAVDADGGNIQVEKMMATWTQQVGYPVIVINTTIGEVSQEQFLLNQTSGHGQIWKIPITVKKSETDKDEDELLEGPGPEKKDMYKAVGDGWVLANINCIGYYRVNYNPENWDRLLQQLESNIHRIPIINRGQLIDDAFNLARAKYVNVTLALNTTKHLRNDTEYIPWESALKNLDYFFLMFDRSEVYGPMKVYLRKQVEPLYAYFEHYTAKPSVPVCNTSVPVVNGSVVNGSVPVCNTTVPVWTASVPHGHTEQYNQINAISVACSNGITRCREMAKHFFNQWRDNTTLNPIPPNLKYTIYCNAIAAGGEEEWEFAWEMFQNATIATERDKLRYALCCTPHIWLLNRYLEYTLDPEKIRKMDAVTTIYHIARNVAGQALAWDFVRAHWSTLSQEYGGRLIDGVTQRFSTEFELQQLRQFQEDQYELTHATRALEQAIERTQTNIKWVKENKQTVLDWFRRESKAQ